MVHVIATLELTHGTLDCFLSEFKLLAPQVLAENGCLEYGATIDMDCGVAAQNPVRPDTVTVIEKWETIEALKRHLEAPHMMQYRERVKDLVTRKILQIFHPAISLS